MWNLLRTGENCSAMTFFGLTKHCWGYNLTFPTRVTLKSPSTCNGCARLLKSESLTGSFPPRCVPPHSVTTSTACQPRCLAAAVRPVFLSPQWRRLKFPQWKKWAFSMNMFSSQLTRRRYFEVRGSADSWPRSRTFSSWKHIQWGITTLIICFEALITPV